MTKSVETTRTYPQTDRELCIQRGMSAAGGPLVMLGGAAATAAASAAAPAAAAAVRQTVQECLANPALCANQAALTIGELLAGDAVGGASVAGGAVVVGEAAKKASKAAANAAEARAVGAPKVENNFHRDGTVVRACRYRRRARGGRQRERVWRLARPPNSRVRRQSRG